MKLKKTLFKQVARMLFLTLAVELVVPAVQVYALTSGPSQPEVQSFEPVGTTDMVDLFSGDFVYNIPLLDVGGYPINISYHSGIGIEDEASWVGLGWNINPGVINRSVRGVPDDFKGDRLFKTLKMKAEKEYKLKMGLNLEFVGFDLLKLNAGYFVTHNNYKGIGMGFTGGIDFNFPTVSTGLGFSVSSLDGADVDAYAGLTFSSGKSGDAVNNIGLSAGTGFNSRSGLKALSYGLSLTQSGTAKNARTNRNVTETGGLQFNGYVPIGLENYVVSQTNKTTFNAFEFSVKFGGEIALAYPHFGVTLYGSTLQYEEDGTKNTFGFLYLQDAREENLMDFSREKDGIYNATLPNLPLSNLTYDVYSVSGHGTGGMFRPFRNDIGTVFDPAIKSNTTSVTAGIEAGVGNGFELGANVSYYTNKVESGPLKKVDFKQRATNSLFENVFFKQAGELTYSVVQTMGNLANHNPINVNGNMGMYDKNNQFQGNMPEMITETGDNFARSARANNISFLTNEQIATHSTNSPTQIKSYPKGQFYDNNTAINNSVFDRYVNTIADKAKRHQIGEITQLLPDGRQYIYGIPAMNNIQKEVSFKVAAPEPGSAPYQTGLIGYSNNGFNDDYYQSTVTPAFAHSYLLTSVLSEDYVDITGDGPTEDDLGEYTKINYTRVSSDFRWRAPYPGAGGANLAQFSPGFYSNVTDDKASYIMGSKEIWHVHSIETKDYIAEFSISEREDAIGVTSAVIDANDKCYGNVTASLQGNSSENQRQYKLDNIKLYSKLDRYTKKQNAVPIKSVFFTYDYSLCKGIPNSTNTTVGKLTLKRIAFKNGNSDISLLNPYEFTYNHNPNYDFIAKDRWGNYKPGGADFSNHENPYVKQDKAAADLNAAAWLLSTIKLPSGGEMNIGYESDDYSYVQDKEATEMVQVMGVGAGEAYDPKLELYEGDNALINDYLYFKIDPARATAILSTMDHYFRDNKDKLVYFSVNLDISGRNRYEPIKGYAKVEKIGKCPGTEEYGFIKLKREKMGKNTNSKMHPITLCALNIGRYYLGDVIYPGSTVQYNNQGNREVLNGLKGALDEMLSLGQNVNARFLQRGLARTINPQKSLVRLSSPSYTKLGGGTRVKFLTVSDKWNSMVANGTTSLTGKYYDYTTEHPVTGIKMSSGVASYEPMIGGDENPLRMPINYTGDAGRLLPPVELFQEGPLGESFYPGASVGYSKVSVTSMHKNTARSSKALDVTEFYTAKDFPIYIDYTRIRTDLKHSQNSLLSRVEKLGISQGYALCMNDMHGKMKAVSNYVLKDENGAKQELIASVKYNYKTDANGKLDNKVKAVLRKKSNTKWPEYKMENNFVLGEEVDYTIDNRMRYTSSMTTSVNANVNFAVFGIIPICIPAVFTPPKTEERTFQTSTATKIIQQYGILSSVENTDHGAKRIVHNTLYDGETGQVLVTKTTNDYKDPVSDITFPAHWMYAPMGGAYSNINYEEKIDSLYIDGNLDGLLMGMDDASRFQVGDELLMTVKDASGNQVYNQRVWVQSICSHYVPFGPYAHNWIFSILINPRAKNPSGNSLTWLPSQTMYKDITVKVLRSGNKNQLNQVMQQGSYIGTMPYSTFTDLYAVPDKMINAAAVTFTNSRINVYNGFPITAEAAYKYNDFIKGLTGAHKPNAVYTFLANRKYDNSHSRTDGILDNFLWANSYTGVPVGGCPDCTSNCLFNSNLNEWQKIKGLIYGISGAQVAEQDANSKWSSVLYGYKNNLPVAVADNTSYEKIQYYGFEDLFMLHHMNSGHLGQIARYKTTEALSVSYNSNGNSYGVYAYPPMTQVSNNMYDMVQDAHTGKYGLRATSATYSLPVNLYSLVPGGNHPEMYFSMWVKPPSGSALDAALLKVNGVTPFIAATKSIEGWYKVECRVSGLPQNANAFIHIPQNYIVDDVRVHPESANMKSFVYDPVTSRLIAQLDENNFASFFEYDREGKLVRTKKETEKGILTLSESRMSTKK